MSAYPINIVHSAKCLHIWQNSRGNDKRYFSDKIWTLYYTHTDIISCIVTERSHKNQSSPSSVSKNYLEYLSVSVTKSQIISTQKSSKIVIRVVFVCVGVLFVSLPGHHRSHLHCQMVLFHQSNSRLSWCWSHFQSSESVHSLTLTLCGSWNPSRFLASSTSFLHSFLLFAKLISFFILLISYGNDSYKAKLHSQRS